MSDLARTDPFGNNCTQCHGATLERTNFAPSCFSCHGQLWATPNQAPVADPGPAYSGTVGQAVLFDGSASFDPDGTIVAYDWDFGDGGTGTEAQPSHTYGAADK